MGSNEANAGGTHSIPQGVSYHQCIQDRAVPLLDSRHLHQYPSQPPATRRPQNDERQASQINGHL